ncbi:hypothetical protein B0H16DRAFT_423118 [Mycena metata]|uniref:DUF6534 domain-containing protein n=1 Tax=Mycena metata TaxID=1033252 RepID=A0AAD7HER1_9AGAR|nr:hypothetical protein B0H16DRAFT_423118 [Mycena metata]
MSKLPTAPPTPPGAPIYIPFPLSTTLGALELGVLFSVFCFGVLTVQVYIYFERYANDCRIYKLTVALVWALDFGHTIAISHLLYTLTVTQYGDPAALDNPPKSLDAAILLSGLIGLLEQGWFTYRLYKFTQTLLLPLICATLALSRFAGSAGLFVLALTGTTIQKYLTRVMWLIEVVVVVGAAVDMILAVSLCYYLSFWRHGGFRRMSKLVNQIMTWTLQTGGITTTGALALLVTFTTMKDNLVYLAFFFIMAKLFSNSLLFSLNARERFARSTPDPAQIPFLSNLELGLNSPTHPEYAFNRHSPRRLHDNLDVPMRTVSGSHFNATFLGSPPDMREGDRVRP